MTDQEIFDLLLDPVKQFIRKKGWSSFRTIQKVAIERIINSDRNFILVSSTASGKTEAAFLPVLSKVDFNQTGVRVLYISPLIALINDQIGRIEELCHYMEVPVTKWHGEASMSAKKKLLKAPRGIMLTTPESIEAMYVNHPENVEKLFCNLTYIIIDELHYFLGTDRGTQLQSIITRLKLSSKCKCQIIGLSATISDFTSAKDFTGDSSNTIVLNDTSSRDVDVRFGFFKNDGGRELPIALVKDVFKTTLYHKSLIFPNSRERVEELSVKLQKLNELTNAGGHYFAHHSSVEKEIREYVENFAKNSKATPFSICCTSTLELGIDIGNVDKIVQVNATSSVSSLVQRAGRSGRRDGEHASITIFSTNKWSLLQAIACWRLHQRRMLEKPFIIDRPYDILLHQMLSIIKQCSEINSSILINRLLQTECFRNITQKDCIEILKYLLSKEISVLELINGNLIIGIDGEKIVNSRDFYSVFKPEFNFNVFFKDRRIGLLQPLNLPPVGSNIFLAAKIWKIIDVDTQTGKIFVNPANDGKAPRFISDEVDVNPIVENEMLDVLYSNDKYDFLDNDSLMVLDEIRKEFSTIKRVVIPMKEVQIKITRENDDFTFEEDDYVDGIALKLFFGTKANEAVKFLFQMLFPDANTKNGFFEIPVAFSEIKGIVSRILSIPDSEVDSSIREKVLSGKLSVEQCSKFGKYLPVDYQIMLVKQKLYDFSLAKNVLGKIFNAL